MGNKDWFRKTTWSSEDKDDFFIRLNRAREYNRAQYLRVQAHHLEETGTKVAIDGALELLEIVIAKYPAKIELANAYYQRATCLEKLDRHEEALIAYRESFTAIREQPNVRPNSPLRFGVFAVKYDWSDLYKEVLEVFEEFIDVGNLRFPKTEYYYFAVMAIISDYFGRKVEANEYAVAALAASRKKHSGFAYHPDVGLVETPDEDIDKKLRRIVAT